MVAYSLLNDVLLSALLGFVTYLALPLVRNGPFLRSRAFVVFNAISIGILIFLLLDVYTDVNDSLFPNGGDVADPWISLAFVVSVGAAFLLCYWAEGDEGEEAEVTGDRTATAVSIGIGFQNLTEGLAFGAAWVLGQQALASVILLGYGVQNLTEGFPIIAAYMGHKQPSMARLVWLFFVRGIPTVIGGVVGFLAVNSLVDSSGLPTYGASLADTAINGVAIGAILYCILPILLGAFQPESTTAATKAKSALIFVGVLAGFLIGFGVGLF